MCKLKQKNDEKIMKTNFKKLHVKIGNHIGNFFMLGYLLCNDNQEVNVENVQIMCYIICYNSLINASNLRTQVRKGLISFYKTNKIYNISKKTSGCRSCYCYKEFWRESESFNEINEGKATNKKNSKCVKKTSFKNMCYEGFLKRGWCATKRIPWILYSFDCEK